MPIPFIKHATSVEHTKIERTVFPMTRPKHKHILGLPKTVPEEMEAYFYSQVPYYHVESRPNFELRPIDASRPIDAPNRVILAAFPYLCIRLKCCIATYPENC